MISIAGALLFAFIGTSFVGFISVDHLSRKDTSDGPTVEDDEGGSGPTLSGGRDILGGNESEKVPPSLGTQENVTSSQKKIPWYLYAGLALTVICIVAVVSISGRAYMESSRQENMVRNDLIDLIAVNPGINLTSIRNELQLSQGAVSYHLQRLEKFGLIYSHKGIKERRYYPATMGYSRMEDQSARDEIRTILSNPTTQAIVDALREGEMTQNQIVQNIGVTPSTVHWHMERLEQAKVIRKRRQGRTVVYSLREIGAET